jgi:hypothetical protein
MAQGLGVDGGANRTGHSLFWHLLACYNPCTLRNPPHHP